jgi:hypothetical protein
LTTFSTDEEVRQASARRTRRSFLVAGIGAIGGYGFYRWVANANANQMLPEPLRAALNFNAKVSHAVFDERGLAPTYPVSHARELRVNGNYGLKQDLVPDSYRLQVVGVEGAERLPQYVKDVTAWQYKYKAADGEYQGHDTKVNPKDEAKAVAPEGTAKFMKPAGAPASGETDPKIAALFANAPQGTDDNNDGRPPRGLEEAGESDSTLDPGTPGLLLKLEDVAKLGHSELVTQFKCIEGWSEIVQWAGVPLRDFIAAYPPAKNAKGELPKYVYMETPNGDYYVGFHLQDCLHPQSTLVTQMSGQPLTQWHGAPMRLHMPIKYGYKQIKRIGLIAYTDDKPDDYWTKLGYDWYAGI